MDSAAGSRILFVLREKIQQNITKALASAIKNSWGPLKKNFLKIGHNKVNDRGHKSHLVAGDDILGDLGSNILKNDNANELKKDGNCRNHSPAVIVGGVEETFEIDACRLREMEEFIGAAVSGSDVKRREILLEDARESAPELGFGRVKHLVDAFEKIPSMPRSKDTEEYLEKEVEGTMNHRKKWILPGFQPP